MEDFNLLLNRRIADRRRLQAVAQGFVVQQYGADWTEGLRIETVPVVDEFRNVHFSRPGADQMCRKALRYVKPILTSSMEDARICIARPLDYCTEGGDKAQTRYRSIEFSSRGAWSSPTRPAMISAAK